MIVAEQKPIGDIAASLGSFKNIVIASCGTCVTVCLAGGEKEALEIQGLLTLCDRESGAERAYTVVNIKRQCDDEFFEGENDVIARADAVLSLACGAGVQFMAEKYRSLPILPALNTKFMGASRGLGYWTEMCQGCGNCILERTGGICPVSRCSKSIFNGPCGGSQNGKCEVSPDIDCGWQLIYDRLRAIGQLDRLSGIIETRDWSTSRDGGPRSLALPDARVGKEDERVV
ncbi:MAG: methylenetetrahydrofolate reductase C-terminal domain-containing protein [Clostridia bacterium]|nr:methylenetetrahydrofolate reductase C-terminal domain-containing protein [Clostridia bacterium]